MVHCSNIIGMQNVSELKEKITKYEQIVETALETHSEIIDSYKQQEILEAAGYEVVIGEVDLESSNEVVQRVYRYITGHEKEIRKKVAVSQNATFLETYCSDQRHGPDDASSDFIVIQTAGNIGAITVPKQIKEACSRGHQGIDVISRCGAVSGFQVLIEDKGIPELLEKGFPTATIEFLAADVLNPDERLNALAQGLEMMKQNDHLDKVEVIIDDHTTGAAYLIGAFTRDETTAQIMLNYEGGEWGEKIKDEDEDWKISRAGYVEGQDPEILALYTGAAVAPKHLIGTDRVFSMSLLPDNLPVWGSLGYALTSAIGGHGFESSQIVLFMLDSEAELAAIKNELTNNPQTAAIRSQIRQLHEDRGMQVIVAVMEGDEIKLREIKFEAALQAAGVSAKEEAGGVLHELGDVDELES